MAPNFKGEATSIPVNGCHTSMEFDISGPFTFHPLRTPSLSFDDSTSSVSVLEPERASPADN